MAKFTQKQSGKEVGQAAVYAQPHKMNGTAVGADDYGKMPTMPTKKDWVPLAGVSIGNNDTVKTDGIKIRGTGCAIKGLMARGPMA
jgi:hypothetical protein